MRIESSEPGMFAVGCRLKMTVTPKSEDDPRFSSDIECHIYPVFRSARVYLESIDRSSGDQCLGSCSKYIWTKLCVVEMRVGDRADGSLFSDDPRGLGDTWFILWYSSCSEWMRSVVLEAFKEKKPKFKPATREIVEIGIICFVARSELDLIRKEILGDMTIPDIFEIESLLLPILIEIIARYIKPVFLEFYDLSGHFCFPTHTDRVKDLIYSR